jgi:hypothetical protein
LVINLVVTPFLVHPFNTTDLFFTRELDYILVTSSNTNSYLEITMDIKVFKNRNFELVSYNRVYNLSLLNGKGKFHVGSIIHQLFEDIKALSDVVPSVDINYAAPAYIPAEVTISYEEKGNLWNLALGAVFTSGTIGTFRMVKGWKPYITQNNFSLLCVMQQDTSRITPKSIIIVPFSHFGNPQIIVKRNGIAIDNFIVTTFPSASGSNKVLYNYFRFTNDLKVGDLLEVFIINGTEIRTRKYLVFPEGTDSTYVIFENTNGMLESYELIGRRRSPIGYVTTKKTVYKELYQKEKKVKVDVNQSLVINTGRSLPGDYKIIDQIIKSDNVWIAFDSPFNKFLQVDATTPKFITEDTFLNDGTLDLDFNILDNSYASIYPE